MITRSSASAETMKPESKRPAPSEPVAERAESSGKPSVRPKLMFDSEEEIRCAFLTLVVKVESLRKKYKEGMGKFMERHGARCNRNLAYLCAMGGEDLDKPVLDLQMNGLTFGEDCFCFDAAWKLLGIEMARKFDKEVSEEVRFPVEWLTGRIHNGTMLISFAEKMQEAKKQ